ncbi:MAG TPA: hypothetical protein VGP46_10400, partial [Acidimicrobiales bacterium]|nr:hypothetical protein [Acidimicrobiales bacterium]
GPIAGTAQAVASAAPHAEGTFGIANADDLYGPEALGKLAEELNALGPDEHLIVGYHLTDTVITDDTVTRGVCQTDPDGYLEVVKELSVTRQPDGSFRAKPAVGEGEEFGLTGEEVVSMNLWGFSEGIFDDLERALSRFDPDTAPHAEGKPAELLLPDVVARVAAAGLGRVRVVETKGRCIGLTHPEDVPLVRSIVAELRA